jgi:hypothetical protein
MCDWLKELSNRVLPIVLALVCFIISEGPVGQAHFFFFNDRLKHSMSSYRGKNSL